MKSLSILELESLEILKQLEHLCESVELVKPEVVSREKSLSVKYNSIDFSVLKRRKNIHAVERYLRKNDVPFYLSDDFEFDDHTVLESSNDPVATYMEIGEVLGEDLVEIKTKIRKLINKLELDTIEIEKNARLKVDKITFYVNQGKLSIGNINITIGPETVMRTVLECTINSYPNEISWDEISEQDEQLKTKSDEVRSRRVRDAKNRVNEKINKVTNIKGELISGRNGNYMLTKKVTKR